MKIRTHCFVVSKKRGQYVKKNEFVYIKLQRHLDSQEVGLPATRSGFEIRILKHIFTPSVT